MQDSAALLSSPFFNGDRGGGFDVERLLAPEQAVIAFFSCTQLPTPTVERVPLAEAAGRVLAEDAMARENHPSHARSTMDGFAVASASAASRRLIAGEVSMGSPSPRALARDEAVRVPTGGALPSGADAVVPQEDVRIDGDAIVVDMPVTSGACVTQPAEDIAEGERVLLAGRRLGGPELGVLATLGIERVAVFRRPRIGIVSTGDELVDVGCAPGVGQIRDSNRYAIAGSLQAMGAHPVQLPRANDTRPALRVAIADALDRCDALMTTGGSSVGARDLVPAVVSEFGEPGAIVHGLRVKPGKPTLLAAIGSKPVIGLPGNPTSALMILEAVVRPIVAALAGQSAAPPVVLQAEAATPFVGRGGWTWFVPARLYVEGGRLLAQSLALRSAQTSLLARAAGYATLGERGACRIDAGQPVGISLFSSGGAPIENGSPSTFAVHS